MSVHPEVAALLERAARSPLPRYHAVSPFTARRIYRDTRAALAPDGTLMIAWAGYDHLQLARAISAYFVDIQERLGGRDDPRLIPLLACIIELLPWLKQWHHDLDPDYNQRMDEAHARLVWSHPGMTSWYKNRQGRVTTTSPWRLLDYWRWTRQPDLADYELR